jgi:hypothetical protein
MPLVSKTKISPLKNWWVLSLSLIALLSLAACGDATSTATTSGLPGAAVPTGTTAVRTTVVSSPNAATTTSAGSPTANVMISLAPPTATPLPAATVRPTATPATAQTTTGPTAAPVPSTAASAPAGMPPILKLSETNIDIGGQVTISGSGFSANTRLKIEGKTQGQTFAIANLITDGKGQFAKLVKLDKKPDGTAYVPGDFTFVVTSSANGTASTITLRIREVSKATLAVSKPAVKFGDEITVTGTSYPPNTVVTLLGGVQNPAEEHGKVKTDAQGKFVLKTTITRAETAENPYPYPYSFTAAVGDSGFSGYVSVTVTDGSANTLYLVLKIVDNQGAASKMVVAEDVNESGKTYLIDFSEKPGITLDSASALPATFEVLKPGNIIEFKGAPVPGSQRGDVPVIKPLEVRVTQ